MVSCERLYRKLLSRICTGNIGKNGKNADATAILNMLPKLELEPISTYLLMLPKLRRPSSTPTWIAARLFCKRMMSAAALATSTPFDTEMPTSAAWSDGASLMPSPM